MSNLEICRDCGASKKAEVSSKRCSKCGSPRIVSHPEIDILSIAHLDCDAFYASIEKRDDASIRDRPVIVGGGRRGVVSAACYIARTFGVRSAMPMFKALKACPDAVVIRPSMEKYSVVGREVRSILRRYTPLIEPLSLDEAFLDLSGTEALHERYPSQTLALIVRQIETEIGVTASIGLSYNKFLAKVASDLDKPRGFAVIGRTDALAFLAEQPVSIIWGAGKALQRKLATDGITHMVQLQQIAEETLVARYGAIGRRMAHFARGQDDRKVDPNAPTKSVSAETTFSDDVVAFNDLDAVLWRLSEKVSMRLKKADLAGRTVTLKLKTAKFKTLTRRTTLLDPTQLADRLYRNASALLEREADGTAFRLIGVGASGLASAESADPIDLADPNGVKRASAERALDDLRSRFGREAVVKGKGFSSGSDV